MNLEERVEVVEKDVTALHAFAQKTHAEREGWYNEFRDARAEARGWGEFAVKANNKVEELAEFYTVVHGEVTQANGKLTVIEDRLDRVDGRLDGIDGRLDGIDEKLKWHGELLRVHRDHFDSIEATQAKHTEMLREHGDKLKEHGDKLKEHDGRFDRIEGTLADQGRMLREQRHLLEQILAKVA
jgi:chromosome segregation ATPase